MGAGGEGQTAAAIGQDRRDLTVGGEVVDGNCQRTGQREGETGDDPLGPVGGQQRNRLAGFQPFGNEAAGQALRQIGKPAVGPAFEPVAAHQHQGRQIAAGRHVPQELLHGPWFGHDRGAK